VPEAERIPALSSLADVLTLLTTGTLEIAGRVLDASNTTLFATTTLDGVEAACVYKPVRGERPLWDFPDGTLAGREVAAYLVSAATGWELVPPTVLRNGPLGPGMCQLWIDTTDTDTLIDIVPRRKLPTGWHAVVEGYAEGGSPVIVAHADDERLRRLALLDAVLNNADRKGGHLLLQDDGHLFGVDHGVTFHIEDKLRTVLWGWSGSAIPDEDVDVLERVRTDLDSDLGAQLGDHLTRREVARTRWRVEKLLRTKCFPTPHHGWPPVPWPAF
jgi:uncharacterized repeat protein (TIGR03843 family)